jgi:hypothetical protein
MTTTVPDTTPAAGSAGDRRTDAREKDIMRFRTVSGPDLTTRNDAYLAWQLDRRQADLWPYFRRYDTALTTRATVASDTGMITEGPAERLDIDMERAFSALRAYARAHNRRLSVLARTFIDGTEPLNGLIV